MPRKPNQRKEYTAHYNRLELYAALVDNVYKQATDEFTKLAFSVNHDLSKAFKWSDYPQTKRRVDQLLRGVSDKVQGVVVNGVTAEWDESNFKNDLLARSVIGIKQFDKDDKGREVIPERFKPYFNNNADALRSFVDRKQKGLNLSQKVWKLSEQYKSDLELALSVELSDGRSAAELSRDIRTYLKEPAKLFRRVRSENGSLQLSKAAKAYHPGTGTYLSSYKNAMRLTRTEINMAYRTADNVRWGKLDFVVGFEVKRSGRGYDCSVCESLAGKYPKDFKFVGWHPHCRCYVIPILKTDEEFWAWDSRGEAPTSSVNEVTDVPSGYKGFMLDNKERIAKAEKNGTLPYFLRDNKAYAKACQVDNEDKVLLRYFCLTKEQLTPKGNYWTYAKEMGLTPIEAYSIRQYTINEYGDLNHRLRNGVELSEHQQALRNAMNRGIEKLEVYDQVCFRGSSLAKEEVLRYKKALYSRVPIVEKGYTSTSLRLDPTIDFMDNVFFEIKSKKGRYLDFISNSMDEHEILFKEGSKFQIIEIKACAISDLLSVTKIVMEEI